MSIDSGRREWSLIFVVCGNLTGGNHAWINGDFCIYSGVDGGGTANIHISILMFEFELLWIVLVIPRLEPHVLLTLTPHPTARSHELVVPCRIILGKPIEATKHPPQILTLINGSGLHLSLSAHCKRFHKCGNQAWDFYCCRRPQPSEYQARVHTSRSFCNVQLPLPSVFFAGNKGCWCSSQGLKTAHGFFFQKPEQLTQTYTRGRKCMSSAVVQPPTQKSSHAK